LSCSIAAKSAEATPAADIAYTTEDARVEVLILVLVVAAIQAAVCGTVARHDHLLVNVRCFVAIETFRLCEPDVHTRQCIGNFVLAEVIDDSQAALFIQAAILFRLNDYRTRSFKQAMADLFQMTRAERPKA